MDFPALVGTTSIVVDSGTKKAGCRPGRNVYSAIYTIMANNPELSITFIAASSIRPNIKTHELIGITVGK